MAYATGYVGVTAIAGTAQESHSTEPPVRRQAERRISPEPGERPPKSFEITYTGGAIQVGKGGKYIKTSSARYEGQNDYGDVRIKTLELLISAGREVPIQEIQDKVLKAEFGDKIQTLSSAMAQVRSWLPSITYRRQPIFVHNGKRGPASAYSIQPDFAGLKFVKKEVTEQPSHEPGQTPAVIEVKENVQDTEAGPVEVLSDPSLFPLNRYETYIVAESLALNNEILVSLGIEPIPEKLVDALRGKIGTREIALGEAMYGSDIKETRRKLFEKLRNFFGDEDLVLRAIGEMSEKDERYGLFQHLFLIEDEDRWNLYSQLASAERGLAVTFDTGRRQSYRIDSIERIVELEEGRIRIPLTGKSEGDDEDLNNLYGTTPVIAAIGRVSLETVDDEDEQSESDEEETITEPTELKNGTVDSEKAKKQEQHEPLAKELREQALTWLEDIDRFNLAGRHNTSALRAAFPFMSPSFVHGASENGLISRDSLEMTRTDILRLIVYKEYRQEMSVTKRTTSGLSRPAIDDILDQAVKDYDAEKARTSGRSTNGGK